MDKIKLKGGGGKSRMEACCLTSQLLKMRKESRTCEMKKEERLRTKGLMRPEWGKEEETGALFKAKDR